MLHFRTHVPSSLAQRVWWTRIIGNSIEVRRPRILRPIPRSYRERYSLRHSFCRLTTDYRSRIPIESHLRDRNAIHARHHLCVCRRDSRRTGHGIRHSPMRALVISARPSFVISSPVTHVRNLNMFDYSQAETEQDIMRINYPIRYVRNAGPFSEYVDRDGEPVFLANGDPADSWLVGGHPFRHTYGIRRLFPMDDVFSFVQDGFDRDDFRILPVLNSWGSHWILPEITQCDDCGDWDDSESHASVGDNSVCEDCLSSYVTCGRCEEYAHENYAHYVDDAETYACRHCYDYHVSYCDECDVNYWYEDGNHDHDNDCDCEARCQEFRVPFAGGLDVLDNDHRAVVTIPGGNVSSEGLRQIRNLTYFAASEEGISDEMRAALLTLSRDFAYGSPVGVNYKDENGTPFAKRVRKYAHKEYGVSLAASLVERVGTIARDESADVYVEIAVTRDLNGSPYEYANEGSCWWGEYGYSRCTLKSNGGFAVRAYGGRDDYGIGYNEDSVSGRFWVIPVRFNDGDAIPTTNAMSPEGYVVFNGYGTLGERNMPRVMSAMTGLPYARVEIPGPYRSNMYVNGECGYLVARQEILDMANGRIFWNLDRHETLIYA